MAETFTQKQIDDWALAKQPDRLAAIKAYGDQVNDPTKFYKTAKEFGVTAGDVDAAYGWAPGTTSKYISEQGMGSDLTGQVGKSGILQVDAATQRQNLAASGAGSYDTNGNFVFNTDAGSLNTLGSAASTGGIAAPKASDVVGLDVGTLYTDGASGVEWVIDANGNFVKKKKPEPQSVDYGQGTASTTIPGQDVMFPTVNPGTDTVEGRIQGILAADNPLSQMVRARVAQDFNRRGMMNSAMAGSAAESAVIQNALGIATPDANTYSAQRLASQSEGNANYRQNQQIGSQEYIARLNAANQQLLAKLDSSTKINMANIEANYKTLMQSSASAGELYQQALKNITDISNNKDLTPEARKTAIQNQITLLKNGFGILGKISGLDLGSLILPPDDLSPPAATTPAPTPAPTDNNAP